MPRVELTHQELLMLPADVRSRVLERSLADEHCTVSDAEETCLSLLESIRSIRAGETKTFTEIRSEIEDA